MVRRLQRPPYGQDCFGKLSQVHRPISEAWEAQCQDPTPGWGREGGDRSRGLGKAKGEPHSAVYYSLRKKELPGPESRLCHLVM